MTRNALKFLTILAFAAAMFCSCSSNDDDTPTDILSAKIGNVAHTSATIEGIYVAPTTIAATLWLNGIKENSINAPVLTVSLNSPKVGTFPIGTQDIMSSSVTYSPDATQSYTHTGISGNVIITEFDATSKRVKGTFSGTMSDGNGNTIQLTEGVIDTSFQ